MQMYRCVWIDVDQFLNLYFISGILSQVTLYEIVIDITIYIHLEYICIHFLNITVVILW